MMNNKKKRMGVRAKALRAAQVMSLAAGLTGCAMHHSGNDAAAPVDSGAADTGPGAIDSGSPLVDSGATADAGECNIPFDDGCPEVTQECCESEGFAWDEDNDCCLTAVIGPLMPPEVPV